MDQRKLGRYDYENLEDCIAMIEDEYQVKFQDAELIKILNFESLVELAIHKVHFEDSDYCTSQHVFYKLRKAILETQQTHNAALIEPKTALIELFPGKNRHAKFKMLEKELDLKLNVFEPSKKIVDIFIFTLLVSFVILFFNFKLGVLGVVASIFLLKVTHRFSKHLCVATMGDLSKKITQENYMKIRRETKTVNKKELRVIFWNELSYYLNMDKKSLEKVVFK